MIEVWSKSKTAWEAVNFTGQQLAILKEIHTLARQMEYINNSGKAHAVIAMIEELSSDPIDLIYVTEKTYLLFM